MHKILIKNIKIDIDLSKVQNVNELFGQILQAEEALRMEVAQ